MVALAVPSDRSAANFKKMQGKIAAFAENGQRARM